LKNMSIENKNKIFQQKKKCINIITIFHKKSKPWFITVILIFCIRDIIKYWFYFIQIKNYNKNYIFNDPLNNVNGSRNEPNGLAREAY
jgi:hypothetical protein